MEYRIIPHGGERVGVIGMGSATIGALPHEEIVAAVRRAVELGVNLFDMAGGHASIFAAYGEALQDVREKVYLQVHFGADYRSGEYGWTTELESIKASVKWELEQLKTDYIDIGFIHCLDEDGDWEEYCANGVLDYVLELKKQGVIRRIGLSSHTPKLVNKVLDLGIVDVVMFSINPMYDYGQGKYAFGENEERQALYRRCEKEGVAITVMKPFGAGLLLDESRSPFGKALTKNQCIRYALDKPAVVSVLPGCSDINEVEQLAEYFTSTDEEKDYSVLGQFTPADAAHKCVYCAHCHPCPAGLDVALINKYYDLACVGDALAKEHYLTLHKTAADCVQCGHCNGRCPFHVDQMVRMQEIAAYFGK